MLKSATPTVAAAWLAACTALQDASPLMEAAEAYETAQIAGDAVALERLLADDYVLVGSDGARQGKAELIAFWTAEGFEPAPVKVTELVEHVWSDGAALGGTVTLTGQQGVEPFSVTIRYVDVWALRDGEWRVIYGQATRVP
ncbi:MAG TPA: nuclear transport factor 2 family protein [Steroidobacteraceae bacterium]|nr:nuclear transport factor 2 family protein [Steroidobacteraceae bacterium]